jgi:hypothetical protein
VHKPRGVVISPLGRCPPRGYTNMVTNAVCLIDVVVGSVLFFRS